tara:strand:+ start:595 stop:1101 length:507 start_codon:yes stop_codon:yes gene_type:complete
MASFNTKTFIKHDDYMTPKSAWEAIKDYIPKDKVIWECFYGDGTSGTHIEELGLNVIHREVDFFENNLGEVLISNPPYSIKKQIFTRLREINKPFIMICPSSCINTQYMRKLFSDGENPLQIIIPRKRIQFIKLVDGEIPKDYKSACNFDCFYYCYKINLEKDIIWLK